MANVGRTRRDGERTLPDNPIVKQFVPSSDWTEDSSGHYLLVDLPDFKKEQVKLEVDSSGDITVSGERLTSDNRYITRFEQTFTLPPNSDMDKISGKFDSGLLYVTVPKRAAEESSKQPLLPASASGEDEQQQALHWDDDDDDDIPENVVEENKDDHQMRGGDDDDACQNGNKEKNNNNKSGKDSCVDSFGEDFLRKWGNEPRSLRFEQGMKMLQRKKGIIITAVLAFSLGVLLSRKFGCADIDTD